MADAPSPRCHRGLPRLRALVRSLPAGLQAHLERVRQGALELARLHGVDPARVETAALGHDLARAIPAPQLLERAHTLGLHIHPVERSVPILLHGPVAAEVLRRECGIDDPQVLEAVRWHSTACAGLGPVGQVVFLADKLDPAKADRSPLHEEVADLARRDLAAAMVCYLSAELSELLAGGHLLHPASIEARNELLLLSRSETASGV